MSKKRIAINIILGGIVSGLSTYLIGHGIVGIILGILIGQLFHLCLLYKINIYNIGITNRSICFPSENEDFFTFKIDCTRHDFNRLSAGFKSSHPVEQFPISVDLYLSFSCGYNENNVVKTNICRPFLVKSLGWYPIIYKRGFEVKEPFYRIINRSWGIYNLENGPLYDISIVKEHSFLGYTLEGKILERISKIIKSKAFTEEFNKALPKI